VKCPYWEKCDGYRNDSVTCNESAGVYYGDMRESSCVREARLREAPVKGFGVAEKLVLLLVSAICICTTGFVLWVALLGV
jgi:hypothetical protein